jgi:hypothetical protein
MMTDTSGPAGANGSPDTRPSQARPRPGDVRVAPEIKSMDDSLSDQLDRGGPTPDDLAPSSQGDVSSSKAATMAKAKTTTSRATTSRARPAARARAAAPKPSAAPEATLSEDDSVLLAALDQAQTRAEAMRDWALIRREEAKDAVRTHPLGSSVVVFAAGMIFGLLLARR